ncbi:unnamed protein product [Pleuronectes platessa]|uniref:NTR domain-containing protein n=1 Tax=Pleuronectes platessa TaxID=8262 RepID=A0A9N7Z067_PLEPL|nr:unnamed protein product [Pleuronectes platessa]
MQLASLGRRPRTQNLHVYNVYCKKFHRSGRALETRRHHKSNGESLTCLLQDNDSYRGSFDVGPQGKERTFLSYPHCRESLDLGEDRTYLIMGTSKDIQRDELLQLYQYVLGERTWIEYWPTDAECQVEEHRPTCLGLEEMVQQYELFGCQQ